MLRACGHVALLATLLGSTAAGAQAQASVPGRATVSVDLGNVWQARNDVRIPPDTGTAFSLVDLIGSAPTATIRVEAAVRLTERQDVRFVYAPIEVTGRGTPAAPIVFAGEVFQAVQTDATYQFSSYRATWRYRIFEGDAWTWRLGFTGFVRDARVALDAPGRFAEDTDVGFVPLGHVSGSRRLAPRWSFDLDLDAAAAPPGRALDLATGLTWDVTPRFALSFGYRTIEGGADVDTVYTFAWLNAAYLRAGLRF
jgi:hypothetical protein